MCWVLATFALCITACCMCSISSHGIESAFCACRLTVVLQILSSTDGWFQMERQHKDWLQYSSLLPGSRCSPPFLATNGRKTLMVCISLGCIAHVLMHAAHAPATRKHDHIGHYLYVGAGERREGRIQLVWQLLPKLVEASAANRTWASGQLNITYNSQAWAHWFNTFSARSQLTAVFAANPELDAVHQSLL